MESLATDPSKSTHPLTLPQEKLNEIFSLREKSESLPSTQLILAQQEQLQQYQSQLDAQAQQIALQQAQLSQLSDLLSQPSKRFPLKRWHYKKAWKQFCEYISSLQGSEAYQPRFSMQQILLSYVGSFLGIAALAYLSVSTHYPLIAAPFGAAAVLVFAVPSSPLAQPRNLVFGNFIGALISVIMVSLFGGEPWVMALSVATAIKLMQLTKTLHPPGGAVALVGVMSHAKWEFLFTPVLTGSIILLLCTIVFNNLMPGRSYPQHWL
jgi:HPP family